MSHYTKEELKEAGLHVFKNFLAEIWKHLDLRDTRGNESPPTPVQNDIADYMQFGPRRIIIEAFRGVGKSWIAAAFVCWLLLNDPQLKILVISASQERADAFSTFVKQLILDVPWLNHLAPIPGQRSSNLAFDVGRYVTPDQSPSVKSAGITGQITGSRADIIIPDDIEIPKNSYSHLLRERVAEQVKEFDAILKPNGRIIYLGTPQVEQSLYNRLPARGYEMRIWPAEVPVAVGRYFGRLAPMIQEMVDAGAVPGTPTDPKRFDAVDLAERRASYGKSGYALQFMLDTNPSDIDRHPLKLSNLIVDTLDMNRTYINTVWTNQRESVINDLEAVGFDGDFFYWPGFRSEETAEYTKTVMFIDPSGKGSNETAYAIVKLLYTQLYLVDVGGFKDGYAQSTLNALAARAARYGVTDIRIEPNYGGGMFNSLFIPVLRKVSTAKVEEDTKWSTGQKEVRILDTLEPLTQAHRLTVDRALIERDLQQYHEDPKHSFMQQFTRLTRDKDCLPADDRVEAVQGACSFFTEKLDKDRDKIVENHKTKLLMDELKNFRKHVVGGVFQPRRPAAPHIRNGRR